MIRRLLLQNLSISQIAGYALATFAGLTIVACAVRFYCDAAPALSPDDNENAIFSDSYIVVSKPVTLLNTFGKPSSFSEPEIDGIKNQPWARDVAAFTAANFSVTASVDFAGRGFATHMFLEAIPDTFIDVRPEGWDFHPDAGECVPVIIPKDYLSLYNFGFAAARGLPQVTPEMLSQVPVNLTLRGSGRTITICARIAGFSSRLNTIAVPMAFMDYANALLAPGQESAPSRLIIRTAGASDPEIIQYLEAQGYDMSGNDADASRATTILRVVTGIVIAIGSVISLLALAIMLLSINLLIQKNQETIGNLIFLGHTPGQIARRYILFVASINITVTIITIITTLTAASAWENRLAPLGITPGSTLPAIATVSIVFIVLTAVNALIINHRIRKIFYD